MLTKNTLVHVHRNAMQKLEKPKCSLTEGLISCSVFVQ